MNRAFSWARNDFREREPRDVNFKSSFPLNPQPGTRMATLDSKNSVYPVNHSGHISAVSKEGQTLSHIGQSASDITFSFSLSCLYF